MPAKEPSKTSEVASLSYADSSAEAAAFPPEDSGISTPSEKTLRIPMNLNIDWYYIDTELNTQGPFKIKELRRIVIEKKLGEETYIWCEECDDWTQIKAFANRATVFDVELIEKPDNTEIH